MWGQGPSLELVVFPVPRRREGPRAVASEEDRRTGN